MENWPALMRFERTPPASCVGAGVVMFALVAAAVAGEAPRRIVSLAPSVTEVLFALGVGERVVGVTAYCDWPPAARKIDRVATYVAPNVEAIVHREPDLILAVPSPGYERALAPLRDLGLRVALLDEGRTLDGVQATIREIGRIVGSEKEAAAVVARMKDEVRDVREHIEGLDRRRVVFVVGRDPLVVAGPGTLVDDLLRVAGGENVVTGGAWPRVGVEYLVRKDPEVILVAARDEGEGDARALFEGLGLAAVAAGEVHAVPFDELMRPGPRLGIGVGKLARKLHPGAFGKAMESSAR